MKTFSTPVLAALTLAATALALPSLSVARDKPAEFGAKPSALVPHHTSHHVYGAPIQPAIVGHRKPSHHPRAPKTSS